MLRCTWFHDYQQGGAEGLDISPVKPGADGEGYQPEGEGGGGGTEAGSSSSSGSGSGSGESAVSLDTASNLMQHLPLPSSPTDVTGVRPCIENPLKDASLIEPRYGGTESRLSLSVSLSPSLFHKHTPALVVSFGMVCRHRTSWFRSADQPATESDNRYTTTTSRRV